jgi:hypothetical protein
MASLNNLELVKMLQFLNQILKTIQLSLINFDNISGVRSIEDEKKIKNDDLIIDDNDRIVAASLTEGGGDELIKDRINLTQSLLSNYTNILLYRSLALASSKNEEEKKKEEVKIPTIPPLRRSSFSAPYFDEDDFAIFNHLNISDDDEEGSNIEERYLSLPDYKREGGGGETSANVFPLLTNLSSKKIEQKKRKRTSDKIEKNAGEDNITFPPESRLRQL